MKGAISFSLFGYNKPKEANSFDFKSYLRDFSINARMNAVIYSGWDVVLNIDRSTYEAYKSYFDKMPVVLNICDDAPLCLAMLWRLKPIFFKNEDGTVRYSHVICRDLDSLSTWKERQAVEQWILNTSIVHAMTDSISHTTPLMGGMVGFRSYEFIELYGVNTWQKLINKNHDFNWNSKGTDQAFMASVLYKKSINSITQHYLKGMGQTGLGQCYTTVSDMGVIPEYKESDGIIVHIGQAGFPRERALQWLSEIGNTNPQIDEAEQLFTDIFYWHK